MSTSLIPASSVTGANVISNPIVLSDDGFDALDARLTNELVGCVVNVQPPELRHYCYEKLWF